MFLNGYPYTDFHELNADFLLKNYKRLLDALQNIDSWIDTHEKEYNELKSAVDKLESGEWSPEFVSTLISWYENHIIDIIGSMTKHVYFGLNDSGYFIVTIPENWKDLIFNTTGLDINVPIQPEYGHLTISY